MREPAKFTLMISRYFRLGWTIYDPFYRGFYTEFTLGFISLEIWSKAERLFSFINCWNNKWADEAWDNEE